MKSKGRKQKWFYWLVIGMSDIAIATFGDHVQNRTNDNSSYYLLAMAYRYQEQVYYPQTWSAQSERKNAITVVSITNRETIIAVEADDNKKTLWIHQVDQHGTSETVLAFCAWAHSMEAFLSANYGLALTTDGSNKTTRAYLGFQPQFVLIPKRMNVDDARMWIGVELGRYSKDDVRIAGLIEEMMGWADVVAAQLTDRYGIDEILRDDDVHVDRTLRNFYSVLIDNYPDTVFKVVSDLKRYKAIAMWIVRDTCLNECAMSAIEPTLAPSSLQSRNRFLSRVMAEYGNEIPFPLSLSIAECISQSDPAAVRNALLPVVTNSVGSQEILRDEAVLRALVLLNRIGAQTNCFADTSKLWPDAKMYYTNDMTETCFEVVAAVERIEDILGDGKHIDVDAKDIAELAKDASGYLNRYGCNKTKCVLRTNEVYYNHIVLKRVNKDNAGGQTGDITIEVHVYHAELWAKSYEVSLRKAGTRWIIIAWRMTSIS